MIMATVNAVYWLPTGRLVAQADRLGPKVGGHWRCFCIHRVNSRSALKHDDCTIKIIVVVIISIIIIITHFIKQ